MRMGTLKRWENSGNRRRVTSRDNHQRWETLGMQEKGHGDTIAGAERQQEEDRFM